MDAALQLGMLKGRHLEEGVAGQTAAASASSSLLSKPQVASWHRVGGAVVAMDAQFIYLSKSHIRHDSQVI